MDLKGYKGGLLYVRGNKYKGSATETDESFVLILKKEEKKKHPNESFLKKCSRYKAVWSVMRAVHSCFEIIK